MTRSRPRKAALALLLATGLLAAAAGAQEHGPQEAEAQRFIQLMESYLQLSNQMVDSASRNETAIYLAIEGISEIYEQRGEKAKAIPHLLGILEQNPTNRTIRNVARFKLRDLYNETGRSDKALEQLELIIKENSQ